MNFCRFLGPLFLLLAPSLLQAEAPPRRSPNVVLIFVDDLGYGELGCQGNKEIPTPHIDSLARDGIRFTQGYVTAAFCSPSRAGLLTGRYQTRFGYEANPVGKKNLDPDIGLPPTEITLARILKTAGYVTGLIGKWHLGGTPAYHPHKHGFDEFFGFLHEGHTFAPAHYPALVSHLRRKEPPYDTDNPLLRGTRPVQEEAYLTEAITREAVEFIERHQDRPFFLYLPYNAVHSPMQAAPEHFDRFRKIGDPHRRVFAAMLSALDDGVGAVLKKLRDLGLDEHTLVVFLSDNGGPTAELTSSNRPLRGGKGTYWEGGVRIPFLLRWTGTLPAGRTYNQPVISLDILPTAATAAGAKLPKDRPLDGVDLLPFLLGNKDGRPHDLLFWRAGTNYALRQGDWKLVHQTTGRKGKATVQLFDLSRDVSETKDLAAVHPERLRSLQTAWDAKLRALTGN